MFSHVLITAGPTREPIDPVRFISNRSSGRVGIALARAAAEAGHAVTLLLGPIGAAPSLPEAVHVERFSSAADLEHLLHRHFPQADVLFMAAAVSDYRPREAASAKRPRAESGQAGWTLELEPTPDLVAGLGALKQAHQRVIGFALEDPAQLESRAAGKMRRKGVDAIIANPLATMEAERIEPLWLTRDGGRTSPGGMSKDEFAQWALRQARALYE